MYEPIEERMMSEYRAAFLPPRGVATHVRLGWPKGIDRGAPDAAYLRRLYMPTLREADLVARTSTTATIYEFVIWRPQTKIAQLLLYKRLLPDTPGYGDLKPESIALRLVTGQALDELEPVAKDAGIVVETFAPDWLLRKLAARRGGR